jgi:beta-glucosidase-like glycosyl hydrolase
MGRTGKAALTTGANYWQTQAAPAIGLPAIRLSDGPHGLRVQEDENPDHLGLGRSAPATCFPPAVTMASSWDPELVEEVGAVRPATDCSTPPPPTATRRRAYASEHTWLLTEVLRGESQFDGLVVSDWGAVHDPRRGTLGRTRSRNAACARRQRHGRTRGCPQRPAG